MQGPTPTARQVQNDRVHFEVASEDIYRRIPRIALGRVRTRSIRLKLARGEMLRVRASESLCACAVTQKGHTAS